METEISDWVDRQKQLYAITKLVLKKRLFFGNFRKLNEVLYKYSIKYCEYLWTIKRII